MFIEKTSPPPLEPRRGRHVCNNAYKLLRKITKLTPMVRVLRCTHPNAICILTAPDL